MRELYKKFNKLYDLVSKLFAGAAVEKKPVQPKKAKAPAAKKAKKTDKENKNPVKAEKTGEEDEDSRDVTRNNDDDDEIRASAQDQSRMADLTTMETPLLESTTNVAKRGGPAAAKAKKQPAAKFEYVHRISYTFLQKLLEVYYG